MTKITQGSRAGLGHASDCMHWELGAAVPAVRPGFWFYLGPRLSSFRTTQCNYSDHKMFCSSLMVPDATKKGDAGSRPALPKQWDC